MKSENINPVEQHPIKSKPRHFLAWSVLNQDLCQLEFFRRVLEEATDNSTPPLERLKFLSVFSSNLDEFFMVRVARLHQAISDEDVEVDLTGLTSLQQLSAVARRSHDFVAALYDLTTVGAQEVPLWTGPGSTT